MEIVLIVGKSHAGKSTLVRSLCGIGDANYNHPNEKNTVLLHWLNCSNHRTFVMASSVNEGACYPFEDGISYPGGNTVAPGHLREVLDKYGAAPIESHCTKAILCISTTPAGPCWNIADYEQVINAGGLGGHNVTHTISLIKGGTPRTQLININSAGLNQIAIAGAPNPPNLVAEAARRFIGLV